MNIRDNCKELLIATFNGDISTTLQSIFLGVDVDWCEIGTGVTPLHLAAARGFGDIVLVLLANGADQSKVDNEGKTAEDYAYENGHLNVLESLIKGCDKS